MSTRLVALLMALLAMPAGVWAQDCHISTSLDPIGSGWHLTGVLDSEVVQRVHNFPSIDFIYIDYERPDTSLFGLGSIARSDIISSCSSGSCLTDYNYFIGIESLVLPQGTQTIDLYLSFSDGSVGDPTGCLGFSDPKTTNSFTNDSNIIVTPDAPNPADNSGVESPLIWAPMIAPDFFQVDRIDAPDPTVYRYLVFDGPQGVNVSNFDLRVGFKYRDGYRNLDYPKVPVTPTRIPSESGTDYDVFFVDLWNISTDFTSVYTGSERVGAFLISSATINGQPLDNFRLEERPLSVYSGLSEIQYSFYFTGDVYTNDKITLEVVQDFADVSPAAFTYLYNYGTGFVDIDGNTACILLAGNTYYCDITILPDDFLVPPSDGDEFIARLKYENFSAFNPNRLSAEPRFHTPVVWKNAPPTTGTVSEFPPLDFDMDGRSDHLVFRDGTFYVTTNKDEVKTGAEPGSPNAVFWPDGEIVTGDFDGDGGADWALKFEFYRGWYGWFIYYYDRNEIDALVWGSRSYDMVVGDFNGDGCDDLAAVRGASWNIRSFGEGCVQEYFTIRFGRDVGVAAEDVLFAANVIGGPEAEAIKFRPSTNEWYICDNPVATSNALVDICGAERVLKDLAVPGLVQPMVADFLPGNPYMEFGQWVYLNDTSQLVLTVVETAVGDIIAGVPPLRTSSSERVNPAYEFESLVLGDYDGDGRTELTYTANYNDPLNRSNSRKKWIHDFFDGRKLEFSYGFTTDDVASSSLQ